MKAAERLARISDIREKALAIVKSRGVAGRGQIGGAADVSVGSLKISYRTPFFRFPPISAEMGYMRALVGGKPNMAYGLDIWHERRKVLNVEWDDAGAVEVISYKPGEWEFLLRQEAP